MERRPARLVSFVGCVWLGQKLPGKSSLDACHLSTYSSSPPLINRHSQEQYVLHEAEDLLEFCKSLPRSDDHEQQVKEDLRQLVINVASNPNQALAPKPDSLRAGAGRTSNRIVEFSKHTGNTHPTQSRTTRPRPRRTCFVVLYIDSYSFRPPVISGRSACFLALGRVVLRPITQRPAIHPPIYTSKESLPALFASIRSSRNAHYLLSIGSYLVATDISINPNFTTQLARLIDLSGLTSSARGFCRRSILYPSKRRLADWVNHLQNVFRLTSSFYVAAALRKPSACSRHPCTPTPGSIPSDKTELEIVVGNIQKGPPKA
jgi:hypothetical protein